MARKPLVVLVSQDLRTRSFIRAQLKEEGIEVAAFRRLEDARQWLYIGGHVPDLFLIDIWRTSLSNEFVKWLGDISDRSPVMFLTGARETLSQELEDMGEPLRRPISIREIVTRIRSRL